jgi:hypothetical protein
MLFCKEAHLDQYLEEYKSDPAKHGILLVQSE